MSTKRTRPLSLKDLAPYMEDSVIFYVWISDAAEGFYHGIARPLTSVDATADSIVGSFTLDMKHVIRMANGNMVENSKKDDYKIPCFGEPIMLIQKQKEYVYIATVQERILLSFTDEQSVIGPISDSLEAPINDVLDPLSPDETAV